MKNTWERLLLVKQKPKKNNSNSDRKCKSNVFQNSENPNSDEELSENEQFIQSKRKINDQPITAASVQSKVSIQNVYIKITKQPLF